MAALSLNLLGANSVILNGHRVEDFRSSKVQALLIYLVTEPITAHRRDFLMTLLWPRMPERSARHNLRNVLYHLRQGIPDLARKPETEVAKPGKVLLLLSNRQTIQLNPAADVESDVERFERRIGSTKIHDHLDLLTCLDCRSQLEQAVDIYEGDFLSDFYLADSEVFEEWAQTRRHFYRRKMLDALETLTTIHMRQKAYPEAQAYADRQIEIDNLREGAYRQLMEILARGGQRSEALSIYETFRRLLMEELGMEPATRTTEVYEKIRAGELTFDAPLAQGVRGYDLKDQIGEGAYGAIHRAIQPTIGREVAVKVIRCKYANDPEFIRRFEAEAQTIARLEHPHIVPLYDYWRDPEGAYLVMRYLRGGSLLSALESGPWNPEPAMQMIDQVTAALAAAHQQDIVHRDIKPANILLDENGNAYLSDFGIAKSLVRETQLTAGGAVLGTPDYISPEQIKSEPVGPASDIYSLGAVLYETLTGERPYPDSSLAELIHKHLTEPVPLVSESRPDLPLSIDPVIQKATAKDPSDRYASALELAEAFRQALRGVEIEEIPITPRPVVSEIYNPYKGLRAFQESDADDFFGRETLVDTLVSRLVDSRFLAVVGPSGSGKSSVVKAGLVPALREGAIAGADKWFVAEMVPGTHPLEELELALWPIAVDPPPFLVEPMERDVRGMLRTIRRILPDEDDARLLLVIDQFEELYTLVDSEERREFFLDSLLAAISAHRSPISVVITLRADFYDRPLQRQPLGQIIKENTEIVLPLNSAELTCAVREPARRVGVGLEEGLTETIVADVADQPGALPLLQYAMTELFDLRQNGQMRQGAYQEIGGVLGALGSRAEEIYADLDKDSQELTRQLFLRLVTLGEGVEDTRRRVLRLELEAIANNQQSTVNAADLPGQQLTFSSQNQLAIDNSQLSIVIDSFGSARLLTFDHDPVTRQPTVEVAHEALLREWLRLRGWLDESRSDVRMQRMLAVAASEWLETNRDSGFLLREARLDQFAGWAESSTVALTGGEKDFLESSIEARGIRLAEEEARRRRELETAQTLAETERARADEQAQAARGLRRRAVILAGALVIAALLAVAAIFFASQSIENARVAQENAAIAATSEAEAVTEAGQRATAQAETEAQRLIADEQRDAALAAEADALAESEQRATAEAVAVEERQEALRQASIGLASQAELQRIGSRPDRAVLLGLEAVQNYPYTWQAERALGQAVLNHRLLVELDHESYVNFVDVSPDETRIVTGADDGAAKVWDVATGELLRTMAGHDSWVFRVFWSPSGDRILTASVDGTAKVWDADTGEELFVLDPGGGYAWWSPDGTKIVTSTQPDDMATIWDGATGEKLFTLSGHEGRTRAIDSWSPDSKQVATGGEDGTVKIWDATTGQELVTLSGHEDRVYRTSFSPDGSRIATSSRDGTATVWELSQGKKYTPLQAMQDNLARNGPLPAIGS